MEVTSPGTSAKFNWGAEEEKKSTQYHLSKISEQIAKKIFN